MGRPIRKKLLFDEESVNKLLQEIYEDTHNIKAKITRIMTKWELKIKDAGEIQALGDSIVKLITAESKNTDQKIMLLKYLKEVVFDKTKQVAPTDVSSDNGDVSDERRNHLLEMVNDAIELEQIEKNRKK